MNFAIALSTFVGQNIGANKIGRVKQGLLATFVMTSGVAIFVSIGVILFGKELMYLFTTASTVIALGHDYLIIVCSFYLVFTTMLVISSVLRGAGDTLIPMFVSLFSLWLVRIPFAYFLSQHFGVQGIWWSIPIGWFCGLLFIFLYYMKGNWKNKSVVSYTNPGH